MQDAPVQNPLAQDAVAIPDGLQNQDMPTIDELQSQTVPSGAQNPPNDPNTLAREALSFYPFLTFILLPLKC